MDDTNSLIEQRKAKLAALRAKGIDPFKNKFTPAESCADARKNYAEGREVALAGRITAHRDMGKSMFMDIRDQSGRIQIYAQKNVLGDEQWSLFTHLDLADFIGVRGTMFTTKTGEISIKLGGPAAKSSAAVPAATGGTPVLPFVILAKALRPPPAKWHGLEDTEIRYRQRYLDLMANPEVKETFLKRSRIVAEIRNFLHSRGFVEVETPMMQAIPGGAAAQPFKTHHNALGCDFFMRIALELPLKRMLVGGVDKVFEIGRVFRNEGLSRKHNPEFTMLEAYQAFGDYESMMELVQAMICHVAEKVLGTLKIKHDQRSEISLAIEDVIHGLVRNENLADSNNSSEKLRKLSEPFVQELEKCQTELAANPSHQIAARACKIVSDVITHFRSQRETNAIRVEWQDDSLKEFSSAMELERLRLDRLSAEKIIDLTAPWQRVKYKDLIRNAICKNWFEISPDERFCRLVVLGEEPELLAARDLNELAALIKKGEADREIRIRQQLEHLSKQILTVGRPEDFEVTSTLFEKLIEPKLIQPTFVTHLPKELVPLAKLSPGDPTTVEVFECCINGQEISPAYTEQNDPIEQRERLEHQAGGEQQKLDEDFLVALEHGMPPAGGMGMGIDRLCMMLLGQESIRDVILFPQLKPK